MQKCLKNLGKPKLIYELIHIRFLKFITINQFMSQFKLSYFKIFWNFEKSNFGFLTQ